MIAQTGAPHRCGPPSLAALPACRAAAAAPRLVVRPAPGASQRASSSVVCNARERGQGRARTRTWMVDEDTKEASDCRECDEGRNSRRRRPCRKQTRRVRGASVRRTQVCRVLQASRTAKRRWGAGRTDDAVVCGRPVDEAVVSRLGGGGHTGGGGRTPSPIISCVRHDGVVPAVTALQYYRKVP